MGNLSKALVAQQPLMMFYAEGLLKDVTPDIFARMPQGKKGIIDTNHPAFVFGHLALYPKKIMSMVGGNDSGLECPAGFADLFEAGKECQDDPKGTIYPSKNVITECFFSGYNTLFSRLAELTDEHLAAPHGLESDFAKKFPSRAALASFMTCAHPFVHIGQISAWRRCMGLGKVF